MKRPLLALGLVSSLLASSASTAQGDEIDIRTRAIDSFDSGSSETRFGDLDYRGGFVFWSGDRRLNGVSSFRFRNGGNEFIAVTDTGLWFEGKVLRDGTGRPVGFSHASLMPILDAAGQPQLAKGDADAEGLGVAGERVFVAFERDHRIEAFDAEDPQASRPAPVSQPIPLHELRSNAGLETVAVSPQDGRLAGATITIAEQSIDAAGNLFAAILGPDGGLFTVKREKPWAATDGAFLPGGDLLLLERRYEGFGRVGMRIRRIPGETIRPGALVDGRVIMEADLTHEIDNMEGLDVRVTPEGETVLSIVSDNNGSFFQRSLYLEFRLTERTADVAG